MITITVYLILLGEKLYLTNLQWVYFSSVTQINSQIFRVFIPTPDLFEKPEKFPLQSESPAIFRQLMWTIALSETASDIVQESWEASADLGHSVGM